MTRFLLLLFACLAATSAAARCSWRTEFVSPSSQPQPPEAFEGVVRAMSMPAIVGKLGPATRDIGSGLHVLEWDVTDGRVFSVSTADACGKPVSVGFRRPGSSNPPESIVRLSGDADPAPSSGAAASTGGRAR